MIVSVGDLATDIVVRLGADEIDPVSDTPAKVGLHRGGAAANVAAATARLGRPARFVGALGSDELAMAAAASLAALGVDVCGPPARRGWSVVVLVGSDGGRRFLTDAGDVDRWSAADPTWLDGAARVHFSGYALCGERSHDACRELAALAQRRHIPRSVDVCSASVVASWGVDRFVDLIADIRPDVVKANADEAALLGAGWAPWAWTVVTNGADPTRLIDPDGRERQLDVPAVPVLDTTGAGDAFVAGFLAAWDAGSGPVGAVEAGHATAARVVGGPGADAWQD